MGGEGRGGPHGLSAPGGGGPGRRGEGRTEQKKLPSGPDSCCWGRWRRGGNTPAGSPSSAGTSGGGEAAAARARRAAVRWRWGEEAALLPPAPCTDIHYLYIHICTHTQILIYTVHIRAAHPAQRCPLPRPRHPRKSRRDPFPPQKRVSRGRGGRCNPAPRALPGSAPPEPPSPGGYRPFPGRGSPVRLGAGGGEAGGSPPPPRRGAPAARTPGSASAQTTQLNL